MPVILHPILYPIVLIMFFLPAAMLALLPAYPYSRVARALWAGGLIVAVGVFVWNVFLKPPEHELWTAPTWHSWIRGVVHILIPFSTSFVLWRLRLRAFPKPSATVTTVVLIATWLLAVIALRTFNETCTYFDYHNDLGQAWCPVSWQAYL